MHFAAYPTGLPLRCIAGGCKAGGTVLDPLACSGTTGLPVPQPGRGFTGPGLSTGLARLAAERIGQAAAGQEATR